MEHEMPKRKKLRLDNYDYSTTGAYYVTICTQDRKRVLSEIVKSTRAGIDESTFSNAVGEGLDPPVNENIQTSPRKATGAASYSPTSFGGCSQSSGYPEMRLTKIGEISAEQLLALEERFSNVEINEYVIMPDHIHAIIVLRKNVGGSRPSPTLLDVMRVYKSMTSRLCKQKFGIEKLFQRSYIEHVIRDKADYETKRKYIYENPIRWYYENEK